MLVLAEKKDSINLKGGEFMNFPWNSINFDMDFGEFDTNSLNISLEKLFSPFENLIQIYIHFHFLFRLNNRELIYGVYIDADYQSWNWFNENVWNDFHIFLFLVKLEARVSSPIIIPPNVIID